jgi:hypothetical protein
MVAVNTGPRNQAIFLNQMMITIIGRWDPSGWIVLGSLEKVRLQFCILQAHITIKRCSKICLNESITFFLLTESTRVLYTVRSIVQSRSISLPPPGEHKPWAIPRTLLLPAYPFCSMSTPLFREQIRMAPLFCCINNMNDRYNVHIIGVTQRLSHLHKDAEKWHTCELIPQLSSS